MDSKRRTVNFSAKEVTVLISLVLKFKSIIECKKTDKQNNEAKQKAWEELADEFNSICGEPFRDAKTLRGKYENQKKRSKQKFADEKVYLQGTGGGPVQPKVFDDIDGIVKDIIGSQMTGFGSEFGDLSKQTDGSFKNISDSEQLADEDKDCAEVAKASDDGNSLFSGVTSKQKKKELSQSTALTTSYMQEPDNGDSLFSGVPSKQRKIEQDTAPSTSTCSVMSSMDWSKMTPEKLKTPKSKPLRSILTKASGKGNKTVLSEKIFTWASNKAESESQQREYLKEEHLLKIEQMKELHHHRMSLMTKESDAILLIQAKKAELELEILQLQKEQLLRN